jgi:hypothetical protein
VVFVNELLHSIDGNTKKAHKAYEKDKEQARDNARKFFGQKIENEDTGEPVYTSGQERGMLPEAIVNTDKKVVAIYPTTDYEYKFIGKEWDGFVPEDQVEEIDKMAHVLSPSDYILVVKMHPNQATTGENVIQRYRDLSQKHSHIIVEEPLSKKDTYALMNRADVIVTFASIVGVEACYAGKPVVLIGDTIYSRMNMAYSVYSGDEAGRLILNGVDPKPQEGAIIWGSYISDYKDFLPGYERLGNGDYLFEGERIGRSTLRRILQLPAKLEIDMSKPGFRFDKAFLLRARDVIGNIVRGKWAVK